MTQKAVFVLGTSSTGKTSITDLFPSKYHRLHIDEFYDKNISICHKKTIRAVRNKFLGLDALEQKKNEAFDKMLIETIKRHKYIVVDDLVLTGLTAVPKSRRLVFLIYAPLEDMVRNIISRRESDFRALRPFEQLSYFYISTEDSSKAVDTISRAKVFKALQKIKWLFQSEGHMKCFGATFLKDMGIVDDEEHFIRPKHNVYDAVINTHGKTPKDIYRELSRYAI